MLPDLNRRLGLTMVLITHEMAVIRAIADRIAVIDKGQIVELGPVWRVVGRPQHSATRALLVHDVEGMPAEVQPGPNDLVFAVSFAVFTIRRLTSSRSPLHSAPAPA